MENWTNDTGVFFLAMIVLLIGLHFEFLRKLGEKLSKGIDDVFDEIEKDFGFTEQEFNRRK